MFRRKSSNLPVEDISSRLDCTELEAQDLGENAIKIGTAFAKLAAAYKSEYLVQSEALFNQINEHGSKDALGRFLSKPPKLPSKVAAMWGRYREADEAHNLFVSAVDACEISEILDRTITICFECLNECGALDNPEKVAEGRRVFETLDRKEQLGRNLGLL